ncbi:hypothetical protein CC85DRAFT_283027 [Cutaneotrichosporon oleaginosum]|uniref:BZIP domain-containing protein n=1 Tax=Cutaneotrichosporon oleaginosum TaxID=879819 RepID=A0A0J0XVK9_9TREE|nr:uncharacterized protein CC85DRAFT_283027 [Cutaneotrichosporon oleaginosum]KLT45115.1 hypothetical protein CC85DRAFT_283027 [Cutaneotrichosporon oleaginosum]
MGTATPPPQFYGGVDLFVSGQQVTGAPASPVQTRSGRISRPPPMPQKGDTELTQSTEGSHSDHLEPPRKRGRPALDPKERLNRTRQRNKEAAHALREKKKQTANENLILLEEKTRECRVLEDRCHELEAQVRELQATLQAHRIPLPSVPGPSRSWRDYRSEQESRNHTSQHASPAVADQVVFPNHQASQGFATQAPPAFPNQPSPAFMVPQYQPVYAGLEALANAALPNLAPQPVAHVGSLDPASAIGNLNTPLHTTPNAGSFAIDPEIQAALDALNLPAYNWQLPDDAMSLSALFTLDDLGEDANDADFVPPTSPKGESESDSDDDEDEEERARDKDRNKAHTAPTASPPDEEEDLFLPIEDVPVPEDQLYADAMAALGVSTPAELKVVVNKIVETASRGGVTPEQVEGLRRLTRLAEVRGATLSASTARAPTSRPPGSGQNDRESTVRDGVKERKREKGKEGRP